MKITVYTISTCPFSKQEKDYLTTNKLSFEEKNVEEHREYLAEMLQVADKFAGVPVTVIEKDDGAKLTLKGFTKEEFDKEFGFIQIKPEPAMAMANAGIKVPPQASSPAPAQPKVAPSAPPQAPPPPVAPVASDATPATSDVAPPPTVPPAESPPAVTAATPSPNEELKSVLDNLQQKAETGAAGQTSPPSSPPQPLPPSSPPDPNLPKIPDFPK